MSSLGKSVLGREFTYIYRGQMLRSVKLIFSLGMLRYLPDSYLQLLFILELMVLRSS